MFLAVFPGSTSVDLPELTGNIISKRKTGIQCNLGYSPVRLQQSLGKPLHPEFENVLVNTGPRHFEEPLFQ